MQPPRRPDLHVVGSSNRQPNPWREKGDLILTVALTTTATLLVTYVFNAIMGRRKRASEEQSNPQPVLQSLQPQLALPPGGAFVFMPQPQGYGGHPMFQPMMQQPMMQQPMMQQPMYQAVAQANPSPSAALFGGATPPPPRPAKTSTAAPPADDKAPQWFSKWAKDFIAYQDERMKFFEEALGTEESSD